VGGLVFIADEEEGSEFFFPDDALDTVPPAKSLMAVDIENLMGGAE
jgi:hypothetical protein